MLKPVPLTGNCLIKTDHLWMSGAQRLELIAQSVELARSSASNASVAQSYAKHDATTGAVSALGVQLHERGRNLRTEKSLRVIRLWGFQLCS